MSSTNFFETLERPQYITSLSGLTPQEIEQNIIARYEELSQRTLYPADPVRLFLECLAYTLAVQNSCIQYAGEQNLLAYATGAHLEHLGALMGVYRLEQKPSRVLIRFYLSEPLSFAVPIPKGTRVATKSQDVIFATLDDDFITEQEAHIDILCEAILGGTKAGALLPSQISELVDSLAYVSHAENIETSSEGDEVEDDERLRIRIREAPETYTVAGPVGSYQAEAFTVSSEISTVSATSPIPGTVDIRFLMKNGELPDESMIEAVKAHLSADDVRPLTDLVLVSAPETVEYEIECVWYLSKGYSSLLASITKEVEMAVEEFVFWQKTEIGRDINPSELIKRMVTAGAKRVVLTTPTFTVLGAIQVAKNISVAVTFGGVEDS